MNKKWGAMLAFAPLVSVVLIFLVIGLGLLSAFVYGMTGGSSIESTTVAIWFFVCFIFVMIAFIMNLVGIIVFCILVCKNTQLETEIKVLWIILIIGLQFIAIPIYWWRHMKSK